MNAVIEVPRSLRSVSSKTFYRCDLYWPQARLAVEYDSDSYHSGADNIAEDARKRTALALQNIEVVTLTSRQILNPSELDSVAALLAKRLNVRLPKPTRKWRERNMQLRAQVLDFSR